MDRQEKNKRVQRKEETPMKRTIRVANQENNKNGKKGIAEKRRPMWKDESDWKAGQAQKH